ILGTASKTVDIGIQPTTTPTFSVPSTVCVGVGPVFTINNSELNVRYQLRNNADNSNSGLFVDGTGGTITLTGSPIVTTTVYNIYGYTLAPFTCSVQLTGTASVTATPWGSWVGGTSIDWNTSSNWSCGQIPGISTNVTIGAATNYPALSTGSVGTTNNLSIGSGASLTVAGNTLQIAGAISNSGTFTASNGTIEMKGSSAQTIAANTFATNTIGNLTVNNASGVTLSGALNVTGIVKATLGNLASGGNLTLKSTTSQTALIDGSGTGEVTGSVTMERYLPSAYGYKYLCTPFTSASLSATLSGNATIPTFYAYNENNSTIISSVVTYISGWVSTAVTGLSPMAGYAANFGQAGGSQTFSMTGTVNNGSMTASLLNHNRTYTLGFNLVGNPYPSPINWNLANRTNVDNAIYFFNASGATDQYSGVYDSYVNGTSSGGSTNIIPSMQGFFVHVSNGAYPVTGSLGFSNAMRTNDPNPTYKAATFDTRPIMRFSASFDKQNALSDAYVIYLDNKTTRKFDSEYDALKLMNTDIAVPNIYEIVGNSQNLSISGMPEPVDSLTRIPIGIKALKEGWINIVAADLSKLPSDLTIYLEDKSNNIHQDLRKEPKYRFYANTGETNNRFALVMAMVGYNYNTAAPEKLFTLSRTASTLVIKSNLLAGDVGELKISNMLGQIMMIKSITFNQTIEVGADWQSGIYVVTLVSGQNSYSEKTIIRRK
ncbi:MAG: T9SS type A sorting domain-containing protein, partial [Bacteroidota bacterium]